MLDWERQWRSAGIVFVLLLVVAGVIYGDQPSLGASTGQLVSFFDGDRTRILIATVVFCFSFIELLWFGAAVSSVLRDAGKGGWAAAATASSAAMAALLFLRMTVRAGLAFSIAGSGSPQLTRGLADLCFVLTVIWFFPAAMFVMSGAFGFWRASLISKQVFTLGVVAVVLALLGGTTWASNGFWAPDGAYGILSQVVIFLWIAGLSGVMVRSQSTANAADRVAVSAA
jgi:hypothetical protein